MQNIIKVLLLLVSCLMFVACSDESNNSAEAKKDHVWKEQTDTINKVKEVESMLMDATENTQRAIKNQSE